MATYFDFRRRIKKMYQATEKAIKRLDMRPITFELSMELRKMNEAIDKAELDNFGRYAIKKELKRLQHFLSTATKKIEANNERKNKAGIK